jgi:hypothetical protein
MTQQINLYDPALERQRDWLALMNVVGLMVVLVAAVGTAGYLARLDLPALTTQSDASENQLKATREQLATLGQQAATRKPDPRLEQEIAAKRLLLGTRGEVLVILRQSLGPEAGSSFAAYLQGLARQSVAGLWLMDFYIDASNGSMEIKGRTIDPALLPEYIRRLNKEMAFQGREFAALKLAAGKLDAPTLGVATAARPSPVAPGTALPAPYHEFTLIPVKAKVGDKGATT